MWGDYRTQPAHPGEEILSCLAVASTQLGRPITLSALRGRLPLSTRGVSVKGVADLLGPVGMDGRIVQCPAANLGTLVTPALLQWGPTVFVVLERARIGGALRIYDPATGWRTASPDEVRARYTGVAIELGLRTAYVPPPERSRLKASSLLRWSPALTSSVVQALIFSIVLQAYVLISPLFMRIVIDDVATTADAQLLVVVTIGFALLAVFNGVATALRSVATQNLQALLGWDMTRRVFNHVLALPVTWFQRRKLGDTLGRIQGLDQVRNVMSSSIGVVLDGLTSALTLAMLASFAPDLALLAAAGVGLYLAIRALAVPIIMRLNARAVVAFADEQGKRIETLRAIQTIKLMGAERARETDWSHQFADTLRTAQANILAAGHFAALQTTVSALITVLAVYLGARQVLDGGMTIGLLTAAIAYQTQFSQRASSLIEQFIQWRMMDVHLDRLNEVMLEPREATPAGPSAQVRGDLELTGVAFSYGVADAPVLCDIDLTVIAGETLVIVGASGVGKSTLLKVLCGLYAPTSGLIRLDGRPLGSGAEVELRRAVGAVMQDDELLSGTILDNVAFFAEVVDVGRARESLAAAAIEEEIDALPAGIHTLVGDMGAALSGGQKQRILLARALYSDPRILVLDEATSHLDVPTEKRIIEALRSLNITRIMAAHRPETIASADRIVRLEAGRLTEA